MMAAIVQNAGDTDMSSAVPAFPSLLLEEKKAHK